MDSTLDSIQPNSVLLETNLIKSDEYRNFLFTNPIEILEASTLKEAEHILKKIDYYIERDLFLAGFISYEAGYMFEKNFNAKFKGKIFSSPLLWFGVYKNPSVQIVHEYKKAKPFSFFSVQNLSFDLDELTYKDKVNQILTRIKNGETYQVNFTFRMNFDFDGDIISFYESLKSAQKVSYSALIHDGKRQILSLSPELFFKKRDREIVTRPMKGTSPRGLSKLDDISLLQFLKLDNKTRAENSMIVDLIRNDLGKISEIGSVFVEKLMEIEEYETLFQMTSTVRSTLKKKINYYDLFKAIFPGGSITGAPKYKTMQIIQELESTQRGIYTGAIGFISKNEAIFNIPIRTIEIENKKGTMGIGSGIVWDSIPENEYKECILKQKFIYNAIQFQLIESILLKKGNFILLDLHLHRLKKSAEYFGFLYDEKKIITSLSILKKDILEKENAFRFKIKLLLSKTGDVALEYSNVLRQQNKSGIVKISTIKIHSTNIFQYHKTTNRIVYDTEYKKAISNELIDYVFLNEKEEVVETSIYNLIIQMNGIFYTPPISSGALAGTLREYLLKKGRLKEKTLTIHELKSADKIYLCNSVRGIMRVNL